MSPRGPRLLAAALALAVAGDAAAQSIGRLFTSEEERANLDEMRYQAQFEQPEPEPEPEPGPGPADAAVTAAGPTGPAIERLTVNGVVSTRTGPAAVWVNGDLLERGGETREGLHVEVSGRRPSVRIRLPSGADSVALKPGQQIEVYSGAVREAYEQAPRAQGPAAFPAPGAEPAVPDEAPAPAPSAAEALEAAARAGVVPAPAAAQ